MAIFRFNYKKDDLEQIVSKAVAEFGWDFKGN